MALPVLVILYTRIMQKCILHMFKYIVICLFLHMYIYIYVYIHIYIYIYVYTDISQHSVSVSFDVCRVGTRAQTLSLCLRPGSCTSMRRGPSMLLPHLASNSFSL